MNPTYLEHPAHGRMVVYNHGKLERSLKSGWAISEHQPDGGLKPEKVTSEPVVVTEPGKRVVGVDIDGDGVIDKVFPERKKPGRPKKQK